MGGPGSQSDPGKQGAVVTGHGDAVDPPRLRRNRFPLRCNNPETIEAQPDDFKLGSTMTALAAKIFPTASVKSLAEFEALTAVALFSAVGLLISVVVIALDSQVPVDWF